MTNIKKIIFITIPLIPFNMLNAELVNPVFSGTWDFVFDYKGVDNCSQSRYEPEVTGKTPGEVGVETMELLNPQTTCKWTFEKAQEEKSTDIVPKDFPGTYDQWKDVINQPPYTKLTDVDVVCLPASSSGVSGGEVVGVSPKYICPPGSRYGYDVQTNTTGCSTLPQVCEGDVVGRDLDYQWPLNRLGHVGITTDFYVTNPIGSVMQVMKDHPAIVEHIPFEAFKNDTAYWGDKYGVTSSPIIIWNEANTMLDEEIKQYNKGSKVTYKWYPTFIPIQSSEISVYNQWTHSWQVQDDKSYPEFRCDTFVDWVYSVALKQMVIPFHQSGTESGYKVYKYDHFLNDPKDLYQDLLTIRDNESDLSSSPHQQNTSLPTGA